MSLRLKKLLANAGSFLLLLFSYKIFHLQHNLLVSSYMLEYTFKNGIKCILRMYNHTCAQGFANNYCTVVAVVHAIAHCYLRTKTRHRCVVACFSAKNTITTSVFVLNKHWHLALVMLTMFECYFILTCLYAAITILNGVAHHYIVYVDCSVESVACATNSLKNYF